LARALSGSSVFLLTGRLMMGILLGLFSACDSSPGSVQGRLLEPTGAMRAAQSEVPNPETLGPYAVGHANYTLANAAVYSRPVFVSVWYPVKPGSVQPTSPPAQYPLDPYTTNVPVSTSKDWEAFGIDPAYEGLQPARRGPFPLVMLSPGFGVDYWFFLNITPRLASHGFVVAAVEHYQEFQWPWTPGPSELTQAMVYRPTDVSFAITELLERTHSRGDLLFGTIDGDQIAMMGHSIGGYTAFALAGGVDRVCDTLWAANYAGDTLPEPASTCVPVLPDRRIRAIVTMDGSSQVMRYEDLARIEIPSLVLGQTVANSLTLQQHIETWIARPHSAIARRDSYRVDVRGANHYSWTDICDAGWQVLDKLGVLEAVFGVDLATILSFWPCVSTGSFDPATISGARAHQIVATYTVAFLQRFLQENDDGEVLTAEYAKAHEPDVYFFRSERCDAPLPGPGHFTYWVTPGQCDTWPKNPPDYFAP